MPSSLSVPLTPAAVLPTSMAAAPIIQAPLPIAAPSVAKLAARSPRSHGSGSGSDSGSSDTDSGSGSGSGSDSGSGSSNSGSGSGGANDADSASSASKKSSSLFKNFTKLKSQATCVQSCTSLQSALSACSVTSSGLASTSTAGAAPPSAEASSLGTSASSTSTSTSTSAATATDLVAKGDCICSNAALLDFAGGDELCEDECGDDEDDLEEMRQGYRDLCGLDSDGDPTSAAAATASTGTRDGPTNGGARLGATMGGRGVLTMKGVVGVWVGVCAVLGVVVL
ncbi:hypothetical protein MKZ38_004275 [Zalerion maritima]|uniref:Uncharacterized protein n=1 Tax=Zalerion maritima TaxID=339359 RepID=A0AAD5WPM8_9PEZI|nr:hypothetical protein MKZ38_004275 [Zalerion maritima]